MLENLIETQKKMFDMWQDFMKSPAQSLTGETMNPFLKMNQSVDTFKDFYQFFENFQKNFTAPTNFYSFPDFKELFSKFQQDYSNIIFKIMGISDITPEKLLENFTKNFTGINLFQPLTDYLKNFKFSMPNTGSFEEMLKMPSFWLTREFNDIVKELVNNLIEYSKKVEEFRERINEQSKKAFEKFLSDIKEQPEIEDFDKFFKKWVDANENIFQEFFKSKEYGETLKNLLKTGARLKASIDKYTQQVLKESNIATKYEIDRAYRDIYNLKKEIKALKKKISELEKKEVDK